MKIRPDFRDALVPQARVEMGLPCAIGDYTDSYTSVHHATTVGKQFRPDNPRLPNYKWVPIGYHGRSSSIASADPAWVTPSSGPVGQVLPAGAMAPSVAPSTRIDYAAIGARKLSISTPCGANRHEEVLRRVERAQVVFL